MCESVWGRQSIESPHGHIDKDEGREDIESERATAHFVRKLPSSAVVSPTLFSCHVVLFLAEFFRIMAQWLLMQSRALCKITVIKRELQAKRPLSLLQVTLTHTHTSTQTFKLVHMWAHIQDEKTASSQQAFVAACFIFWAAHLHQVTVFSCFDASCVHFNKTSAGFSACVSLLWKQEEMPFTIP